jgi:hypothetical protein
LWRATVGTGVPAKTRSHDTIERGRRHRLKRTDGQWVRLKNLGDQAGLALALKRLLARRHLIDHHAEGKNIGACIGLLAFQLHRQGVARL